MFSKVIDTFRPRIEKRRHAMSDEARDLLEVVRKGQEQDYGYELDVEGL